MCAFHKRSELYRGL